jgi:SAM-dependent methyltransferase
MSTPSGREAPAETSAEALARLYDLDLQDDPGDLDLWTALAAEADGPVLELMAGSGRIAIPLAEDGHAVTAVDLDGAMLARRRARARLPARRSSSGSPSLPATSARPTFGWKAGSASPSSP